MKNYLLKEYASSDERYVGFTIINPEGEVLCPFKIPKEDADEFMYTWHGTVEELRGINRHGVMIPPTRYDNAERYAKWEQVLEQIGDLVNDIPVMCYLKEVKTEDATK